MNSRQSLKPIIGTLWIVVAICVSCDFSDYSHFLHREKDYYVRLAEDCDTLLPRAPVTTSAETRRFAQETNTLPATIRELHPTHIQITGDAVLLTVGSYFIVWRQSDQDKQLWILVAYREGHRQEVYSHKKPA